MGYNVVRLLFDWPYTVRKFTAASQRLAICNSVVLLGALFAAYRLVRGRVEPKAVALFSLWLFGGYLAMLSIVSAVGRYFVVIAPAGLALFALAAAAPLDRWLGATER